MKAGPPPHDRPGFSPDESDSVWALLGRAPLPEPDGWFTARTLARCRHEGLAVDAGAGAPGRFAQVWRWSLGGGLGLCLAVVLLVAQTHSEKVAETVDKQKNVQDAFAIMASVDSDSDSSSSPWQDSSL